MVVLPASLSCFWL